MKAPFYVLFAGVNGAGKTTFYKSDLWQTDGMPKHMARVNPDEIVRELGGDWRSAHDNLEAGKRALHKIDAHFKAGRSFNQETTLCGKKILANIERARALGYRIFVYYIGVDSPETSLARIAHRVSLGGHDIASDVIRRRYNASITALSRIIDKCEQVVVFDNTDAFACKAIWVNGTLAWWGASSYGDNWLADAIVDDSVWQRT